MIEGWGEKYGTEWTARTLADTIPPNESVHFTTIQKWASGKQVPSRNFIGFVEGWPNLQEWQRQILVAAWKATRTGDGTVLERLTARLEPNEGAIASTEWYSSDVDRREALGMLTGALTVGGLSPNLLSRETTRTTDEWGELAWSYGRAYRGLTQPMVSSFIDSLSVDIDSLNRHIEKANGQVYRHMQTSSAYMHGILALSMKELGQEHLPNILKSLGCAIYAADQSGNTFAQVWARGQAAREYVYTFGYLERAVQIATEAIQIDANAFGEAHSSRAMALVNLGRKEAARGALEELERALDNMPPTIVDDVTSQFGWPEERLRFTESYVYSHIGDGSRAQTAQRLANGLYGKSATSSVNRVILTLHEAMCSVVNGDVKAGAQATTRVLQTSSVSQDMYVYSTAQDILANVPRFLRKSPEVAELRFTLAEHCRV